MKRYRVVVVDDQKNVLSALVCMLTKSGLEAQGFDEAENMLAEVFDASFPPREPPDLVLTDLRLKPWKNAGNGFG
jgi:FixJ family two-component response regulator